MAKETLKLVVAGHIDHGKSTLIGRLLLETNSLPKDKLAEIKKISKTFGKDTELAYLADQLKEERERNITIETTEIFLKTPRRDYIFIDTPGHLEFIKNMLTGASHADAAIIIIDAGHGIQEQTRRHAYLIRLLALRHVIVVVNKMDLVGYRQDAFEKIHSEIMSFFDKLTIESSHVIPVSAKQAANITRKPSSLSWYTGPTLLKAMEAVPANTARSGDPLRLPVQDKYDFVEQGIIVGKIAAGTIKKGEAVVVLPSGEKTTVREIRLFERTLLSAEANTNIGVVLDPPLDIQRGAVICHPGSHLLVKQFTGSIIWLADRPLNKGDEVMLRCSTQECPVTVESIRQRIDPSSLEVLEENAQALNSNEAGIVTFSLRSPGVIENFADIPELGRYTVERDLSLQGAGTVIDKQEIPSGA